MTRFVTWDLQERSGGALRRALPDQQDIVYIYQVSIDAAKKADHPKKSEESHHEQASNHPSNGWKTKTHGGGRGTVVASRDEQ